MSQNIVNLKRRLALMVGIMLISQSILIAVAISKSKNLLNSFIKATKIELPATRYITYSDMLHDGIRAIVFESLYANTKKEFQSVEELATELKEKNESFQENIQNLKHLELSSEVRNKLANSEIVIQNYSKSATELLAVLRQNKIPDLDEKLAEFEKYFKELETELEEIAAKVQDEAKIAGDQGQDIVISILIFSIFSFVISGLFGIFISLWTKKTAEGILSNFTDIVVKIKTLVGFVAGENAKVKTSTSDQAAAIQQTVAALSEMTSMISKTSDNVNSSRDYSELANSKVNAGQKIVDQLGQSMQEIQMSNTELQGLTRVIENIRTKTAVINDIVFKTQLLSFNASIEAARAGQHGRGFAVVAEEVGNLANMSGQAAKEIEALISDSQYKMNESLTLIRQRLDSTGNVTHDVQNVFQEISQNIQEISLQMRSISESTQQQEIGIQQSNIAIKQMELSGQINLNASMGASDLASNLLIETKKLTEVSHLLSHLLKGDPS
jgi:methyl-accepting chemotaxis protein